PAARPGDAAGAPAGDDDVAIAKVARRTVAALQGRRRVGAVEQLVTGGVAHGVRTEATRNSWQNTHVQQRGRLEKPRASERRPAGPVCCNALLGPVTSNVPYARWLRPPARG